MKRFSIRTFAALIATCALPMAAQAVFIPYTTAYTNASVTAVAGAATFNNFDGTNLVAVATTTGGVSNTGTGLGSGNWMSAIGGSSITVSFASLQDYFGMQWGTNDNYNQVSLYNGSTLLMSFNGAGDGSTSFVNITASGSQQYFDRVVLSSSNCCFEVDNLAARAAASAVPEPGAFALVGTGLFLAGAARRRRQA